MKKKKIIVTGANGYIGSCFIKQYSDVYDFVPVSLSSGQKIDFKEVDTIIHLSALVHQKKKLPYDAYYKINTLQTYNLAKKAKESGVNHFIFFSTVAVYGSHGDFNNNETLYYENSICFPKTYYAKSKLEAENKLVELKNKNFKISIIRPPMVYGKSCPGNIIKLKKLVSLSPVLPFNYSKNKRSMVYIENLLFFLELVINNETTGILIPQDNDKISIKEIVDIMLKHEKKKKILFMFPKPIFNILKKMFPSIIASLYGNLQFNSNHSNSQIGYYEKKNTEKGISSLYM